MYEPLGSINIKTVFHLRGDSNCGGKTILLAPRLRDGTSDHGTPKSGILLLNQGPLSRLYIEYNELWPLCTVFILGKINQGPIHSPKIVQETGPSIHSLYQSIYWKKSNKSGSMLPLYIGEN